MPNAEKGQFKPGRSGNPGGRPKGLAEMVRSKTKDGAELVDLMLQIARGKLVIQESHFDREGNEHSSNRKPRHQDIIAAIEWLADRGFGKPVQPLEHFGGVVVGLPDDVLERARAYAKKR